jgi:ribosomal protein L35
MNKAKAVRGASKRGNCSGKGIDERRVGKDE